MTEYEILYADKQGKAQQVNIHADNEIIAAAIFRLAYPECAIVMLNKA